MKICTGWTCKEHIILQIFNSTYKQKVIFFFRMSGHGSLNKAPLSNVSDFVELLNNVGDSLRDVVIFSNKRQTGSNLCAINNGGCSELCLFDGKRATCSCTFGIPVADGKCKG